MQEWREFDGGEEFLESFRERLESIRESWGGRLRLEKARNVSVIRKKSYFLDRTRKFSSEGLGILERRE